MARKRWVLSGWLYTFARVSWYVAMLTSVALVFGYFNRFYFGQSMIEVALAVFVLGLSSLALRGLILWILIRCDQKTGGKFSQVEGESPL